MNKYYTKSNIIRSLDFIKTRLKLSLKATKEYKTNFWLSIFSTIVFTTINFAFLFAMQNSFNDIINWSFNQYIFFLLIHGTIILFSAIFWFDLNLNYYLLQGNLNNQLVKPLNPFLQHLMGTSHIFLGGGNLIYLPLIIFFLTFIYTDYTLLICLRTLLFVLLTIFGYILIYRMLESFAFFVKNFRLIMNPYNVFSNTFDRYPATIFKFSPFYILTFISINAFSGTFASEIFFYKFTIEEYWFLIKMILSINIFCLIIILILWKIGLKKYEAFGG